MIKIQKDNNVKIVTQGAYREFYEHLGYKIVTDKPLKKEIEVKPKEVVEDDIIKEDKTSKLNYSRK